MGIGDLNYSNYEKKVKYEVTDGTVQKLSFVDGVIFPKIGVTDDPVKFSN